MIIRPDQFEPTLRRAQLAADAATATTVGVTATVEMSPTGATLLVRLAYCGRREVVGLKPEAGTKSMRRRLAVAVVRVKARACRLPAGTGNDPRATGSTLHVIASSHALTLTAACSF